MRKAAISFAFGFSIFLLYGNAAALTVQIEGGSGSTIPEIVHLNGDPLPLSINAQLFNESDATPVTLTLWQLRLMVVPSSGATGSVELTQLLAPDTSFFDSLGLAVVPPDSLPSTDALIQDVDFPLPPNLPGKSLGPEESREIANLRFSSPDDATGAFFLVLGAFNSPSPLSGSVWLPDGLPSPTPFANAPGPDLPGEITLAKLLFGIQAADFSEEGNVDATDLAIWKNGFGVSIGASHVQGDSNSDGDVDGADFLNWQRQFESNANVEATQIPEPAAFTLAVAALLTIGISRMLPSSD